MKKIFFNDGQLRNGWWIAIFIGLIIASQPIYKPLKNTLAGFGATETMLELVSPMLIVLITWICIKLRRETLKDVGLKLNLTWMKQLTAGLLVGSFALALVAGLIVIMGGVSFSINPQASFEVAFYGLYLFAIGSLLEELLHHGFIFQRLIDGIGEWPAQVLIGALFVFGHWGNPGMSGITQVISSIDLFMGAIIFGLAYIKTNSLALPIGLHLGWNWMQGNILGFGVSGHDMTGLLTPEFHALPEWLTGGQFGPEASVVSLVVSSFILIYFAVWPGTIDDPKQQELDRIERSVPLTVTD